ncbi:MAG: TetR/AcrR family transcriptional regulator [Arenicella sp.]|jgi:AcrR family transcriptional regulator|nr:TetR/AcrR family transcriptional regulator [Arenicella sp.]
MSRSESGGNPKIKDKQVFDVTKLSKRVLEDETTGKSRRNSRSKNTIQAIMDAAEKVILSSGVDKVSILDVCKEAKISRGTFYRYFSCQNELLEAFSAYKRERFHRSFDEAITSYSDPHERFEAFIGFISNYLEVGQARQLLRVAPEYAFGWFQSIFQDSIARFQSDLSIVFDEWDKVLEMELDRALICEAFIRYILSEQLVPATKESRKVLIENLKRMVAGLIHSAN